MLCFPSSFTYIQQRAKHDITDDGGSRLVAKIWRRNIAPYLFLCRSTYLFCFCYVLGITSSICHIALSKTNNAQMHDGSPVTVHVVLFYELHCARRNIPSFLGFAALAVVAYLFRPGFVPLLIPLLLWGTDFFLEPTAIQSPGVLARTLSYSVAVCFPLFYFGLCLCISADLANFRFKEAWGAF